MKSKIEHIKLLLSQIVEAAPQTSVEELLWVEKELARLIHDCDSACNEIGKFIPEDKLP